MAAVSNKAGIDAYFRSRSADGDNVLSLMATLFIAALFYVLCYRTIYDITYWSMHIFDLFESFLQRVSGSPVYFRDLPDIIVVMFGVMTLHVKMRDITFQDDSLEADDSLKRK